MSRLFWLAMTVIGFVLAFIAKSAGVLGIGLLLGIVGFFGFVLAMAAARVSASARPETSMASVEDLGALRKGAAIAPAKTPPVRSTDARPTS